MPEPESGKYSRKVGRRHNPPSGDDPLAALARELVALKISCGDPSYKALAESSGVYTTALVEAGRGVKLHAWYVIHGYVRGCWAYHERIRQNPLEGSGDWSHWQQLYRDAGGVLPDECPPQITSEEQAAPSPVAVTPAAARPAAAAPRRLAHVLRVPRIGGGTRPRRLAAGVTACVALVIGVTVTLLLLSGGKPRPAASTSSLPVAPMDQGGSIAVAAPALACGNWTLDGFRSPASTAFRGIKTVSTVSLEGVSVSVMQGMYNGISYDWAESHPTGSRAGIQLRWSNAPQKWYYCTATVQTGDVSALPGEFTTIAVPETVSGRDVSYQACIWHQHPFTEQCSGLF
jgi:hypothetical protein